MDAELERWRAAGRTSTTWVSTSSTGSMAPRRRSASAAADPRLPVQLVGLVADLAHAGRAVHCHRARHDRHGLLRQARRLRLLGGRPRRRARGAARAPEHRQCHILAHDLGDSVGQELLARSEFGEQSMVRCAIESITWLNGGLFNEAYTPRTMQKLMSGTPLGDIMSPLQGSPLSRRILEPTINEMFGPNTKPSRSLWRVPPDPRLQRRQAGAAQGRTVPGRSVHASQPLGARHASDHGADAADRRTHRPQLRCAHGASVRQGHPRRRMW